MTQASGHEYGRFVPESMAMRISSNSHSSPEELKRQLARAAVIRNACELDLLTFLHRHPRSLLTSEQLAGLVGYNIKDIAKALDGFIDAGLVGRTAQRSLHAARLFLLLLDGPRGGPLRPLLELATTSTGRQDILDALKAPEPLPDAGGAPELRLA